MILCLRIYICSQSIPLPFYNISHSQARSPCIGKEDKIFLCHVYSMFFGMLNTMQYTIFINFVEIEIEAIFINKVAIFQFSDCLKTKVIVAIKKF